MKFLKFFNPSSPTPIHSPIPIPTLFQTPLLLIWQYPQLYFKFGRKWLMSLLLTYMMRLFFEDG